MHYHVVLLTLPSGKKKLSIYSVGSHLNAAFSSNNLEECKKFVEDNSHLETSK